MEKKYTRRHPRIEVDLPVRVTTTQGEVIHTSMFNISPAGLQLGCDPETAVLITKGSESELPGVPTELDVQLSLPVTGRSPTELTVRCRVAFTRRVSEREFRIGLQFLELDESEAKHLETYIDSLMLYP